MIVDAFVPRAAAPAPGDDFWYGPQKFPRWMTQSIGPDTALQVTAVLACVRVLAESVAMLPLHLMMQENDRKKKATDKHLYGVLHDQPNERQTSFEFREMQQGHLCLRGNAYSLIRPGPHGAVEQLIPLHPDRMQVFLLRYVVEDDMPELGRLGYLYEDDFGRKYKLTQEDVWHLRAMALDGMVGMSVLTTASRAINLAQQADIHGEKWWENAAKPGGVVKFPQGVWLKEDDHKRLKKSWRAAHTADDLYTVALLEGGAEWQPLGVSMKDAEFITSRRFQVAEISRIFRVPLHMVNSAIEHGMTYANVEHSDLAFVKHSLLPWLTRWEQSVKKDLITDDRYYAKHALEGLLRGDSKTRAEFYKIMVEARIMLRNECRELEDLDPIEGGDEDSASDDATQLALDDVLQRTDAISGAIADNHTALMMNLSETAAIIATREDVEGLATAEEITRTREEIATIAELTHGECASVRIALSERVDVFWKSLGAYLGTMSRDHADQTDILEHLSDAAETSDEAVAKARSAFEQAQTELRKAWARDIAERIAGTERDELSRWLSKRTSGGLKAKDRESFNRWASDLWGGRLRDFTERHIAPWIAASQSKVDSHAMADEICEQAIAVLTGHEKAAELNSWMETRADKLAAQLLEDCTK